MNNSGAGILWPASDHSRRESWQLWPSHRSISIAACMASFCLDLARTYSPDRTDTFRAALCSIRRMVWFFSSLIMDHRQAGYSRNYIKLCPARRISLPPPPAPPHPHPYHPVATKSERFIYRCVSLPHRRESEVGTCTETIQPEYPTGPI